MIAGEVVFAPDDEVAEVFAGGEGLGAGVAVGEGDGVGGGDAETVVERGSRAQGPGFRGGGAAAVVVEGFVVGVVMGCGDGLGEVAAGAVAGVGVTGGEKLLHRVAVEVEAVGLLCFVLPGDAQPVEVFAHGGGEVGAGAVGVEVFVAQPEGAFFCPLVGYPEGAGVAEVEEACGGWGEAAGVGGGHGAGSEESIPQGLKPDWWRVCETRG